MVNINAVWQSVTNAQLAGFTASSIAYVSYILMSYRQDMFTAGVVPIQIDSL